MIVQGGNSRRLLVLGPDQGWHASQLREASDHLGHHIEFASYESISAFVSNERSAPRVGCECGLLTDFDAILTRTMPAASMERITFRLSALHLLADGQLDGETAIVNSPRGLEWSIDKFAASSRLAAAGYPTPATRVVQSRSEAMEAFSELGGDCVVKPLFGGEGRGVMRIRDRELAWYSFSTLDQLDSVLQIQAFVAPGGVDTRLLVIGDEVIAIRRRNPDGFRTNVAAGAVSRPVAVEASLTSAALAITQLFQLRFASVDVLEDQNGAPVFLEVNAVPGWKSAQSVYSESIAERVIATLASEVEKVTP